MAVRAHFLSATVVSHLEICDKLTWFGVNEVKSLS
ncbi:hypothetical protein BOA8489_01221 [Boseongicola aestuarii]|uniref:Uncharacterized protein n=1 Tax=Boseongicola aestuarii TaxID=1470561 RepID=A0A238IXB9_9RHOB|nr:hypothetical protein BOA8489_01221 [Boseongicola aestuarii]